MTVRESMRVDDLDASEAYDLLRNEPRAQLIDVRRDDERASLGAPSLEQDGRHVVHVVWPTAPGSSPDGFVAAVEDELAARGVGQDDPVLFVCRSGVRSKAAAEALTGRGWKRCINVAGGFSGRPDLAGWADRGLPISNA